MSAGEGEAPDGGTGQEGVDAEMVRYGITRVPADIFHYREYRYAKLSDAIAQAKRDANTANDKD